MVVIDVGESLSPFCSCPKRAKEIIYCVRVLTQSDEANETLSLVLFQRDNIVFPAVGVKYMCISSCQVCDDGVCTLK